jgi:hypothetical protein
MARTTTRPAQRHRRPLIVGNTGRRARLSGAARHETSPGTTWTKVAVIVNVIAAALNLGTATLHALPASPTPTAVIVIYALPHCYATSAGAKQRAADEARRLNRRNP